MDAEGVSEGGSEPLGYEIVPPNFGTHEFSATSLGAALRCQVLKMDGSLYLWVGGASDYPFADLSFAIQSKYESVPVGTRVLGPPLDTLSVDLAKKLCKKFGKPLYLSCNLSDPRLVPDLIKRILQEYEANPDKF